MGRLRGGERALKAWLKFELIAVNSLGNEMCNASVSPSRGELFIRTHKHLWCVGGPDQRAARE